MEVGPRDLANRQCRLVIRRDGSKQDVSTENIGSLMVDLLESIQRDMLAFAREERDKRIVTVLKWDDFVPALEKGCMVLTPFCDQREWEEKVKVR